MVFCQDNGMTTFYNKTCTDKATFCREFNFPDGVSPDGTSCCFGNNCTVPISDVRLHIYVRLLRCNFAQSQSQMKDPVSPISTLTSGDWSYFSKWGVLQKEDARPNRDRLLHPLKTPQKIIFVCFLLLLFDIFSLGVVDTWGEGGGSYGSPQWEVLIVTMLAPTGALYVTMRHRAASNQLVAFALST